MKYGFINITKLLVAALFLFGIVSCENTTRTRERSRASEPDILENPPENLPELEISGEDFGAIVLNTDGLGQLTITNSGTVAVTNIRISGLNHPFSLKQNVCGTTLEPGLSCQITIDVSAQPIVGTISSSSEVEYTFANQNFKIPIGLSAEIKDLARLLTHNIDFGRRQVGTTFIKQLVLRNPSAFEDIRNVSFEQVVGSQFILTNGPSCGVISSRTSCQLNIEFSPKASAKLNEDLEISYDIGGQVYKETVSLAAEAFKQTFLTLQGENFGTPIVNYNGVGEFTITIRNAPNNNATAKNFTIQKLGLRNAGLLVAPSSSCATAAINAINNSCQFILKTTAPVTKDIDLNANLELRYKVNGLKEIHNFTVNGSFKSIIPQIEGNNFGKQYLEKNVTRHLTITIRNPGNSSVQSAKNFRFDDSQLANTILELDQTVARSTCFAAQGIARGGSCNFVINAKISQSQPNFNKDVVINYKDQNNNKLGMLIKLTGNFELVGTTMMGDLELSGTEFSQQAVEMGKSFDITLTLKNNNNIFDYGSFRLERFRKNSALRRPLVNYFISISPTSTCKNMLPAGASCTYVLTVKPDQNHQTAFDREFYLLFDSNGGLNSQGHKFKIKGSWRFVAPLQNGNDVPVIKDAVKIKDFYFDYMLRESMKNPLDTTNYAQSIWDLVTAGKTFSKMFAYKHVPWTFDLDNPYMVKKLKDIVPDRIVDPVTNKRYVKLYHGTTDELLDVFKVGASSIAFNVAVNKALGEGFYLTANANEARAYACMRFNSRKNNIVNKPNGGLLLVVGVEENEIVQGHMNVLAMSTGAGDPTNNDIYFRRNHNKHLGNFANQFVFFSNAKPYLRVFEIIRLKDGFGKSTDITDENNGDGYADNNPGFASMSVNYRCNF